jgi:6-phosphofructo-2-kinase
MVGLPARGKSYITRKIQRYLSWQQHNCMIFNVGERRRERAGVPPTISEPINSFTQGVLYQRPRRESDAVRRAAHSLLNHFDQSHSQEAPADENEEHLLPPPELMEQSAEFFDPSNASASQIREQLALNTLDELLDYLLVKGGSVGILDATNSTLKRRMLLFKRIKAREPKLGILFIESICEDKAVCVH